MLPRVLEPEVMDTAADAGEYDRMDHAAVNAAFVADFLAGFAAAEGSVLDVGTGTALIPVELAHRATRLTVVGVDAAGAMIELGRRNVLAAGVADRVHLTIADARTLPFPGGHFPAVLSNSLLHHIADPGPVVAEMIRVCRPGGTVFVRDLIRPTDDAALTELVATHTAGATPTQRQLFADSLRAAFTLDEVWAQVARVGAGPDTVRQTSDRHWTWHFSR